MQLLVAIVQSEDADTLLKRLNAAGFRVTRINTVGGFLAQGNVTVLTGVEDHQVEEVIAVIQKTCRTRRSYINPTPLGTEPIHLALAAPAMPLEVLIGGATIFTFPVRRFVRAGESSPLPGSVEPELEPQAEKGTPPMNLVLAFIQSEDVEQVTRALLDAGHRVTRINTAGAFLRRGNVTLLIGVEEPKADEVIGLIEANTQARRDASPAGAGESVSSATIFVLDASRALRV
jgi:uncharacterized protein YaaQ